jgi:hypothetical protein
MKNFKELLQEKKREDISPAYSHYEDKFKKLGIRIDKDYKKNWTSFKNFDDWFSVYHKDKKVDSDMTGWAQVILGLDLGENGKLIFHEKTGEVRGVWDSNKGIGYYTSKMPSASKIKKVKINKAKVKEVVSYIEDTTETIISSLARELHSRQSLLIDDLLKDSGIVEDDDNYNDAYDEILDKVAPVLRKAIKKIIKREIS